MAEVKWIKIVTDIFDDEKILLIESMPESDAIIVVWFKLLCLAGKNNNSGVFMLNDKIHYTDEMLSTIFRKPLNTVRLALKTFEEFGMIEIINNVITIPNWEKHQTLDSIEKRRERQKEYMRERRAKQKLLCKANSKANSKANVSPLERDKEEDKEEDIDIDKIIETWNSLNLNKLVSIKNKRLDSLKARVKEYGFNEIIQAIESIQQSSFLKGNNNRNWTITFDWFIKPNNCIKVIEGNYVDKENKNGFFTDNSSVKNEIPGAEGIDWSKF